MLGERLSIWWNGLLLRLSSLLGHLLGQGLPQPPMVGDPCLVLGGLGPQFMTGMPTAMSWLEPSIFLVTALLWMFTSTWNRPQFRVSPGYGW